jgi:hypothetical protein
MAAKGGPVESFSIRGRLFPVAADADVMIDLGGYSNEIEPNGDGQTGRVIQSVRPWSFKGIQAVVDHDRGDLEFIQEIQRDGGLEDVTVTLPGQITFQGRGTITEYEGGSVQKSTTQISISGPGTASQQ